jgi:hypothetical protein
MRSSVDGRKAYWWREKGLRKQVRNARGCVYRRSILIVIPLPAITSSGLLQYLWARGPPVECPQGAGPEKARSAGSLLICAIDPTLALCAGALVDYPFPTQEQGDNMFFGGLMIVAKWIKAEDASARRWKMATMHT